MKRILLTMAIILLAVLPSGYAQVISKNAIGIRLENNDGIGPQFTYQRAVGDNNRFEFDLGVASHRYYDIVKFTTFYHWAFNITGGLNWFVGFGAGVGIIDADHDYYRGRFNEYDPDYSSIFFTGDGDVGLEYSFLNQGVPLQLALDLNPAIQFGNKYYGEYYYNNDFDIDVAFSVRYQF